MEDDLHQLKADFQAHAIKDEANQAENIMQFGSVHDRLDIVATKEDVEEIKSLLKAIRVGTGIFSFTFNNAAKIGSLVLFIIGIYAVLKFGIAGAVIWFTKLINGEL